MSCGMRSVQHMRIVTPSSVALGFVDDGRDDLEDVIDCRGAIDLGGR